MSDAIYPLPPIGQLDVQRFDRTIFDEFEDGSQQSRRLWTSKYFKRRFTVSHENLTEDEFKVLANFFTARDGRYDSFWYRDNHNRGGNAKVRLAGDFPITRSGKKFYSPRLVLEQTAPVRELPGAREVQELGFGGANGWYDANRTVAYYDNSTLRGDTTAINQALTGFAGRFSDLSEQSGLISPLNVGGYDAQYQYFYGSGSYWLRGDSVDLLTTQPAATVFALCKVSSVASKSVLLGVGSVSSGAALGIAINASNQFEPWLGGSEVWTNAKTTNVADTWHSVAVTWASGSNDAKLYVDGAHIGTDTVARSFSAGRVSLLAAPNGTLKLGSGLTNSAINHAIFRDGELLLSHIQALHNLFAHQYGLTTV